MGESISGEESVVELDESVGVDPTCILVDSRSSHYGSIFVTAQVFYFILKT